ncbi:putative uncharacterized protein, partial [Mycolicibacterium thermoresistibile]
GSRCRLGEQDRLHAGARHRDQRPGTATGSRPHRDPVCPRSIRIQFHPNIIDRRTRYRSRGDPL